MTTVFYWRYFNETTSDYEYVWSETLPTVCRNPQHVMQRDSLTRLNEISSRVVETRNTRAPVVITRFRVKQYLQKKNTSIMLKHITTQ